jgi:hypothetical protein
MNYRLPRPKTIVAGRSAAVVAAALAAVFTQAAPAQAQAVPAAGRVEFARLLPGDAFFYVHVASAARLRDDWWQTSLGRMIDDPQFRPLIDQSFAAAEKAFEPAKETIGLSLAELLRLPKGEIGIAVVPVDGRSPQPILLVEAADDDPSISTLLTRGREAALKAGMIEESETVGDTTLTIFRAGAGRRQEVVYLRRQGALLISPDRDAVKKSLELWNGESAEETLAGNQSFTTLARLVGRAEGAPAELTLFLDPIGMARATARSPSTQVALAMLPAIGLDGLSGIGASLTFNRGPFETIGQAYVLVDVPRTGVLELIALQPTETEPEPWVFNSVAHYITLAWDVERTYHQARKLVDTFQGEGGMRRALNLQKLKDGVGIDFETEILTELNGRFSVVVANRDDTAAMQRSHLFGAKVKNRDRAAKVLQKFVDKGRENLEVRSSGGTTYYKVRDEQPEAEPDPTRRPNRPGMRVQFAFGLIDDYLLMTDDPAAMEKAIAATQDPTIRLSSSLDYKLIAGKAKRYAGEQGPGLLSFTRPDEDLRFFYNLLHNEQVRTGLGSAAERNPFMKDLNQALADRPPPPFEVLQKYFAPGGAILVDEPTGLRYLTFVLKREQ